MDVSVFPPTKIYLKKIPGKGRGVFAEGLIQSGELIEECPVSFISRQEDRTVRNASTTLRQYLYVWDDESEEEAAAIVFGYGMLYNHSNSPNMRFEIDFDKPSISWFAKRDIQKDEECVFDYDVKLWFNPVE